MHSPVVTTLALQSKGPGIDPHWGNFIHFLKDVKIFQTLRANISFQHANALSFYVKRTYLGQLKDDVKPYAVFCRIGEKCI